MRKKKEKKKKFRPLVNGRERSSEIKPEKQGGFFLKIGKKVTDLNGTVISRNICKDLGGVAFFLSGKVKGKNAKDRIRFRYST